MTARATSSTSSSPAVLPRKDLGATKNACLDVFASRDRHPWPPTIRVEPGWPEQFRQEADEIGFPVADVRTAAVRVQEIVDEIDRSA